MTHPTPEQGPLNPFGLTGAHHLAFATGDMDKTLAFWRDLLGFKLTITMAKPGERQYFMALDNRFMITFFEWPEVKALPYKRHGEAVKGPAGFDHLALGIKDETALFQIQEQLVEAEFPVSDVIDHGFILSLYSFDPNHIPIEFTFAKPGIDPFASPVLGDPNPGSNATEGSMPIKGRWPKIQVPLNKGEIVPGEGVDFF